MKFETTVKDLIGIVLLGFIAGCTTSPPQVPDDQAPDDKVPASDAVPTWEPPSITGNPKSYVVFGKRYTVRATSKGYRQRGIASWYGPKFHGKRTSSGAPFNMYTMTAAHKSLPIPTYARVTHLGNGHSIVVKINDRGPFIDDRIIDLSYAAAKALDIIGTGTAPVEVVALPPYQYLPDFAPETGPVLADADQPSPPETVITLQSQVSKPSSERTDGSDTAPQLRSSSEQIIPVTYQTPLPDPRDNKIHAMPQTMASASPEKNALSFYLQVGAFSKRDNAERLCNRLTRLIDYAIHIDSTSGSFYKVWIGPFHDSVQAEQLKIELAGLGLETRNVLIE
jgi:rare lipoprotein A